VVASGMSNLNGADKVLLMLEVDRSSIGNPFGATLTHWAHLAHDFFGVVFDDLYEIVHGVSSPMSPILIPYPITVNSDISQLSTFSY
jgi:hypothetical protein